MAPRHHDDRVELPIIVDGVEAGTTVRGRRDDPVELPIIGGGDAGDAARRAEIASDATPGRGARRRDGHILAAAAVGAVAIVAAVAVTTDAGDPEPPAATGAPALAPIAAPDSDDLAAGGAATVPNRRSRTVVGTIEWRRSDGGGELPARVDVDAEGALVGVDAELRTMRPVDGASGWLPMDTVERTVAGDVWRRRRVGGATGLGIVTPLGRRTIDLGDLVEPIATGFEATIEPVPGLADGFPIELDGDVFLLASTRVRLPWHEIAEVSRDGSYRAELFHGDRSIRFTHGRFNELAVEEFHMVPAEGSTYDVRDAAGETVWSFAAEAGRAALDTAAGHFETTWLRWNGSRFVAIERPWPDWHDVDMVRVDGGVLARSDGPLHRDVALWFSSDGHAWARVALPAERAERTPVGLHRDDGGAIITMFAPGGQQAWSTGDGAEFRRQPDVPGLAQRRRGDFGWVAAHPRSAPTLRVSADGILWEELDIGPLLDLDESRWDVTITAAADRDRIVVVADRPEYRSVLVGRVVADGEG